MMRSLGSLLVAALFTLVAAPSGAAEAPNVPAAPADCCAISTEFQRAVLDTLPLRRNSGGLFAIAPTVAENGRPGRNGGGARMDNNVVLDGLEITNPHFGDIVADPSALTLSGAPIWGSNVRTQSGNGKDTRAGPVMTLSSLRLFRSVLQAGFTWLDRHCRRAAP